MTRAAAGSGSERTRGRRDARGARGVAGAQASGIATAAAAAPNQRCFKVPLLGPSGTTRGHERAPTHPRFRNKDKRAKKLEYLIKVIIVNRSPSYKCTANIPRL